MEEFKDPALLAQDELVELRAGYAREHHWLCLRRWVLFDQIDLLRAERVRRLKEAMTGLGTAAGIAARAEEGEPEFGSRFFQGSGDTDPISEQDAELTPFPLVSALSDQDIHELLRATKRVEDDTSLRRQVVWARLKALDAQLLERR